MQESVAGSELILASYSMNHLGNLSILAHALVVRCDNTQSVLSCICIHSLVSILIMQPAQTVLSRLCIHSLVTE